MKKKLLTTKDIKIKDILNNIKEINKFGKKYGNNYCNSVDNFYIKIIEELHKKRPEKFEEILLEEIKVLFNSFTIFLILDFFNKDILEEKINKKDLNDYAENFIKHFKETRAGILLKRKGIIEGVMPFKIFKNGVIFRYGNSSISDDEFKKYKDVNSERFYDDKDKILVIKKPLNLINWTSFKAISDSLYENDLIFNNIKIIE